MGNNALYTAIRARKKQLIKENKSQIFGATDDEYAGM